MASRRVKFATQVDGALLADLRNLADDEGRQIQALVEEAIGDLVAKHRGGRARPHVMAAYEATVDPYGEVYRKLAR